MPTGERDSIVRFGGKNDAVVVLVVAVAVLLPATFPSFHGV